MRDCDENDSSLDLRGRIMIQNFKKKKKSPENQRQKRTALVVGRPSDPHFLPASQDLSLAFELAFWMLFPQCWRQSYPFLAGNRISPEVLLPFLILYLNHPVCFSLRNLNGMQFLYLFYSLLPFTTKVVSWFYT